MDPVSVGCRLCLFPCAEKFDSINNVELKKQMEKVFFFEISIKRGFSSHICQSCSNTISEFYTFSQRVYQNQYFLNEQAESNNVGRLSNSGVSGDIKHKTSTGSLDKAPEAVEIIHIKVELSDDTEPVNNTDKRTTHQNKASSDDSEYSDFSCDDDESDERAQSNPKDSRPHQTLQERNAEEQQIQSHYQMICDVCGQPEQNYKLLFQHYRKKHHRKGYIVCCQKKLTSRKYLLEHITFHTDPNAFRCDQCSKSYKSLEYLSLHKLDKHGSIVHEHPFKCDECGKTFPKNSYLNRHKEVHQKIQCQVCDRVLSSSSSLSVHMSNMHSDKNRSLVCDVCGQEFLNKLCFERHLNEHRGIEVQKLQCHVCKKWYRGGRNLQNHIQYTHNQKGRDMPCDVCHQRYPNERAMKKHRRQVHVEERFECEFCGKRFKQSFNLKEHRATHTGEVLYSCDYCGVTKNSRANFYVHVKKKHPQEWAERKMQAEEANAS